MKKKLRVTVEGKTFEVEVEELESSGSAAPPQAKTETVSSGSAAAPAESAAAPEESKPAAPSSEGEVVSAPIPGKILSINVEVGDKVNSGDQLLILEAMKMENEVSSTVDGEVKEILAKEGQSVQSGDGLVVIG